MLEFESFCELAVSEEDISKYSAAHNIPEEDFGCVLGAIMQALWDIVPPGNRIICSDAVNGFYIFTIGLLNPGCSCVDKIAERFPEISFLRKDIDNCSVAFSKYDHGVFLEDSLSVEEIPGFPDYEK